MCYCHEYHVDSYIPMLSRAPQAADLDSFISDVLIGSEIFYPGGMVLVSRAETVRRYHRAFLIQ